MRAFVSAGHFEGCEGDRARLAGGNGGVMRKQSEVEAVMSAGGGVGLGVDGCQPCAFGFSARSCLHNTTTHRTSSLRRPKVLHALSCRLRLRPQLFCEASY